MRWFHTHWAPHEALLSALPCPCARAQRVPIKAFLNAGNNSLTFRISPAADAARQRAKDYPYPVPYLCTPTAPASAALLADVCSGLCRNYQVGCSLCSGKYMRAFKQRAAVVRAHAHRMQCWRSVVLSSLSGMSLAGCPPLCAQQNATRCAHGLHACGRRAEVQIAPFNFLRKAASDFGWDWCAALRTVTCKVCCAGIYEWLLAQSTSMAAYSSDESKRHVVDE